MKSGPSVYTLVASVEIAQGVNWMGACFSLGSTNESLGAYTIRRRGLGGPIA